MNYTLYIDESGDFVSQKGQWVLSGMLFSDTYENCEAQLINKLENMPREFNLGSIRDFHLTEFRRDFDHSIAVDMAIKVFNKLDYLPFDYYGLVTINYSKISLSNREKTYRLMLADLLAMCETVLPENQVIENLDLVVATRTIDGKLQTSISNIQEEIIKSLPIALEVDLATKGMVDLIGKHIKVKMDYANKSWGLVCADFLANLSYHNRKEKEKKYLYELEKKGKYTIFESFGDFESRRASVSERDNDFVLALYRWIIILANSKNEKASESIQRILSKIFNKRGTSGAKISFEALLEQLWRNNNSINNYKALINMLFLFEEELEQYFKDQLISNSQQYMFRLRNLMLIVCNHLGDTSHAISIANKQHIDLHYLASNPEYFQIILDFKAIEIEIYINSLELEKALSLSIEYSKLIANYREVWQLLVDEDIKQFEYSRAYIKSSMILFRCNILNIGLYSYSLSDDYLSNFDENTLKNNMDISRFSNYKVMLLLKQKKPKLAMNYFVKLIDETPTLVLNIFDLFWFLRSINDSILAKDNINILRIKEIVNNQLTFIDLNIHGHPMDIILREVALFEFHINDKSKALKYIRKSQNAFKLENSNISIWLETVNLIHEDYIKGATKNIDDYFKNMNEINFIQKILNSTELPILERIRYFSPY